MQYFAKVLFETIRSNDNPWLWTFAVRHHHGNSPPGRILSGTGPGVCDRRGLLPEQGVPLTRKSVTVFVDVQNI
ncbi:MAG: hypothetical protein VYA08_04790 [Pseudomonadota bacterium]|nr:hypothetical protein [Pseudomonadota bacterium]